MSNDMDILSIQGDITALQMFDSMLPDGLADADFTYLNALTTDDIAMTVEDNSMELMDLGEAVMALEENDFATLESNVEFIQSQQVIEDLYFVNADEEVRPCAADGDLLNWCSLDDLIDGADQDDFFIEVEAHVTFTTANISPPNPVTLSLFYADFLVATSLASYGMPSGPEDAWQSVSLLFKSRLNRNEDDLEDFEFESLNLKFGTTDSDG